MWLEELFYNSFLSIFGDPIYIGLCVLAFFTGFVFMQNVNTTQKISIIVPASLLAGAFIPFGGVISGLLIGVFLGFLAMRLFNR